MNDEIKQMLECLRAVNDGGCVWPVYQHEAKILLDYITNLQNKLQQKENIIEEEKKIPEKLGVINYCEDQATALIHHKVDEIIDYLKSKGE